MEALHRINECTEVLIVPTGMVLNQWIETEAGLCLTATFIPCTQTQALGWIECNSKRKPTK